MADVHRDTLDRLDCLCQLGYRVVTVWECTWVQQKKSDANVSEFVERHDVEAPLDPYHAFYGGQVNAAHLYYKTSSNE